MSPTLAVTDAERLSTLLNGHIVTQLVASAVRLGIPDHLEHGPVTEDRLSELTGIGRSNLRRFLRAVGGLGLVERVGTAEWSGTSLCALLRQRTGLLYGHALMSGAEYYEAWSDLDYALQSGEAAFDRSHGHGLWEHLARKSEVAGSFARTMRCNSTHFWQQFNSLYAFPSEGLVVDLGAGDGTLLAELLRNFPRLRGIALERPAVVPQTQRTMAERGVSERCSVVAGDLLTDVPKGGDIYILKSVIHNWCDAKALLILRNCRASMREEQRLLVIERSLECDSGDDLAVAIRDLTMLVLFGARDRTLEENRALLEQAGFHSEHVLTTPAGVEVLEAAPAPL